MALLHTAETGLTEGSAAWVSSGSHILSDVMGSVGLLIATLKKKKSLGSKSWCSELVKAEDAGSIRSKVEVTPSIPETIGNPRSGPCPVVQSWKPILPPDRRDGLVSTKSMDRSLVY